MKQIIFFKILLIISFPTIPFAQKNIDSTVQFLFSQTQGKDVYQSGDYLGYKIKIYFDGKAEYYKLFYQTDQILKKTKYLNNQVKTTLIQIFEKYEFDSLPKSTPSHLLWPSSTTVIGYRPSKKDEMKKMILSSGIVGEERHIRKKCFELEKEISEILSSIF